MSSKHGETSIVGQLINAYIRPVVQYLLRTTTGKIVVAFCVCIGFLMFGQCWSWSAKLSRSMGQFLPIIPSICGTPIGLSISCQKNSPGGTSEVLDRWGQLKTEDRVMVHWEVNQDAYVSVVWIDGAGLVEPVYPVSRKDPDFVAKGPGNTAPVEVYGPAGPEWVVVAASAREFRFEREIEAPVLQFLRDRKRLGEEPVSGRGGKPMAPPLSSDLALEIWEFSNAGPVQ